MDATFLPAVNAILNGTSAILLVAGYKAIRSKAVLTHKACMLSAMAVSSAFLASYLYYHFVIKEAVATRFADRNPDAPAAVANLYYLLLASHTILAAAVAPLALVTAYLGLTNRLKQHMSIARWTLPIWLYVSVTGVVVYWMLYRLYPPP